MGNNLSRRVPAAACSFGNGIANTAELTPTIESIVCSVVEEIADVRDRIDDVVINHLKNSSEFEVLKVELSTFLEFISKKVLPKTGAIAKRRSDIEEMRKRLGTLKEDLKKLAHEVHVDLKQASSVNRRSKVALGISGILVIASLCTGNGTAIAISTGCGFFVGGYSFFGDGISETEIKDLLSVLLKCRSELAENMAQLDTLLWNDMLSHHDD